MIIWSLIQATYAQSAKLDITQKVTNVFHAQFLVAPDVKLETNVHIVLQVPLSLDMQKLMETLVKQNLKIVTH